MRRVLITIMTDLQSFARLQAWLSPAFPTGAFSYSHGLEQAIHDGLIKNGPELQDWLSNLLARGAGWNDAVLLSQAWLNLDDKAAFSDVAELAEAMSISKERHLETMAQGFGFLNGVKAWGNEQNLPQACALPVAVGFVSALHKTDLQMTIVAYLHAYISTQIQAALRLMPLGQQGGVEVLANIEPIILDVAQKAQMASLDDLGSAAFIADIASMKHETLTSRIFRS